MSTTTRFNSLFETMNVHKVSKSAFCTVGIITSMLHGLGDPRAEWRARLKNLPDWLKCQGGHGTGKTGNLAVNFSRQGKHREFSKFNFLHRENCANTGKILKI